jgi:hypothetical protein
MVRGDSGRIVIEIDPSQKENLYYVLKKNGLTLKEWFLLQADYYLRNHTQKSQRRIPIISEAKTQYRSKNKPVVINPVKKRENKKID